MLMAIFSTPYDPRYRACFLTNDSDYQAVNPLGKGLRGSDLNQFAIDFGTTEDVPRGKIQG